MGQAASKLPSPLGAFKRRRPRAEQRQQRPSGREGGIDLGDQLPGTKVCKFSIVLKSIGLPPID